MKKFVLILFFSLILHSSLFISHSSAQWVQQTLPVNGIITDIAFLNANTGFVAIANSSLLLRTTDGGANWTTLPNFKIGQLEKIDSLTIYGLNNYNSGTKLYRSFNSGSTWDTVGIGGMCSMSFITKDTGFISTLSGIYKTTDGGISAQFLSSQTTCGILFFLKQQYNGQYYGFHINNGLYNTTNSGINWSLVNGVSTNVVNVFFLNKDSGWVSDFNTILFTSNNGANWVTQLSSVNQVGKVFFANDRKGWCGAEFFQVYATSNGGINWGTQTTPILSASGLYFIDSLLGWAYNGFAINNLMKTTNGGGNINAVEIISSTVPKNFQLIQNYPNPFNPSTTIKFEIKNRSYAKLIIHNILGKEINILVNEELNAGSYKVTWNAKNYPSGIYYYTLITENYKETKKMILIK